MSEEIHVGELGLDYAEGRKKKKSLIYRVGRRTDEVVRSINKYLNGNVESIVDLGTADGMMLDTLSKIYKSAKCVGVEYNKGLYEYAKKTYTHLEFINGDIQKMDFDDNQFDVAVATAVLEHVVDMEETLKEIKRVLKPGGILVVTCPDPFWEHLATMVGHLQDDQHVEVPTLKKLKKRFVNTGFKILKAQKFMLSPVGMPLELPVEKLIRFFRLDFMMANQLIVGKKTGAKE